MVIVPNKNSLSAISGKNTPYTFSTPIIVKRLTNMVFPDVGFIYTITYPDGSSLTVDTDELNLEGVYYPAGTTIEFEIKDGNRILQYIECKYVK